MLSPSPPSDVASELVAGLLSELELAPRARKVASAIAALFPASPVVVYTVDEHTPQVWTARAVHGGVAKEGQLVSLNAGIVEKLESEPGMFHLKVEGLTREQYRHLDIRQELVALSYIPMFLEGQLLGCIEIIWFRELASEARLEEAAAIATTAAAALRSARAYEIERNSGLAAVSRMAQLYDIEKIFCATLDMQQLLPIICGKLKELAGASIVNLWMVDGNDLLLSQQAGGADGSRPGDRIGGGKSLAELVGDDGEPRLQPNGDVQSTEAPALSESNTASSMAAPLIHEESLVGVLEAIRQDGLQLYTEDDLFTLTQVADSAAQALHNSSLLEAERKIAILQTLVSVSKEITSTLNQGEVLQAIVNQPQRLFSYERCVLALEDTTKLRIRAISGKERFDASSPEIVPLLDLLQWIAAIDVEIRVQEKEGTISHPRSEVREKLRRYFDQTGSRSFYAVPLADEQGRLGVLSFESSDPDFLSDLYIEVIKILAGQATVALRNATLYKDVPFVGLLQPMMQQRRRFLATSARRRIFGMAAFAAFALLLLIPVPMRVSGQAVVDPGQTQYVRAEEDGVIANVFVHEGEEIPSGAPLVQMADWSQRADLASVEARYNTATTEAARALVGNDAPLAGQRQLEANYLRTELSRKDEELARTTIHAALPGTVATPHVENLIGRRVLAGDPLLEMVSTAEVIVDVAVSQRDVLLLRAAAPVRIKLESLPRVILHGRVAGVSTTAQVQGDERLFFARVAVSNPHGQIRPGMQGFAKIGIGLRPLGVFLLRTPALWAWSKIWSWFSW